MASDKLSTWYHQFMSLADELRGDPKNIGRFFVFRDNEVLSTHESFDQAYEAARAKFEDGDFIIQLLEPHQAVNFVFEH